MIKNFNPSQNRDRLINGNGTDISSSSAGFMRNLRTQVVGSPKVVGSEHPSLEITKAIFAASDKAVGSKGRQDA